MNQDSPGCLGKLGYEINFKSMVFRPGKVRKINSNLEVMDFFFFFSKTLQLGPIQF